MVGQEHVLRALINALDQNRLHHAYLFSGTRGVGKTTIARILAKCLNCDKAVSSQPCGECSACVAIDAGNFMDLIEVDAASRTKVEDTRELLDNVQYAPSNGRFKVYLIDEVHMLSGHSFNALLKTLEEPPPHVKFLLATTDPQKLPITVLSRCLQFHLKNLSPELICAHLVEILIAENIQFEAPALTELAQAAQGSMRDALSLLDQAIAYGNGVITEANVQAMLNTVPRQYILEILKAITEYNPQKLLELSLQINELSLDYSQALESLLSHLHQIAIIQALPNNEHFPELTEFALKLSKTDTQLFYQIALLGRQDLQLAPSTKMGFEMTLLRMLEFRPAKPVKKAELQPIKMPTQPQAPNSTKRSNLSPQKNIKDSDKKMDDISEPQNSLDWNQIVKELSLKGILAMLADHCQLKSLSGNNLILQLNSQHSALLNHKQQLKLQECLSEHLQLPINLSIELADDSVNLITPIKLSQAKQAASKEKAKACIEADSALNTLLESFNATLDNTSINAITLEE